MFLFVIVFPFSRKMSNTVIVSGIPQFITVHELNHNIAKILKNFDVGSFELQDLQTYPTLDREIAIIFSSHYDAAYMQKKLNNFVYKYTNGKSYMLQTQIADNVHFRERKSSVSDIEPALVRHSATRVKTQIADDVHFRERKSSVSDIQPALVPHSATRVKTQIADNVHFRERKSSISDVQPALVPHSATRVKTQIADDVHFRERKSSVSDIQPALVPHSSTRVTGLSIDSKRFQAYLQTLAQKKEMELQMERAILEEKEKLRKEMEATYEIASEEISSDSSAPSYTFSFSPIEHRYKKKSKSNKRNKKSKKKQRTKDKRKRSHSPNIPRVHETRKRRSEHSREPSVSTEGTRSVYFRSKPGCDGSYHQLDRMAERREIICVIRDNKQSNHLATGDKPHPHEKKLKEVIDIIVEGLKHALKGNTNSTSKYDTTKCKDATRDSNYKDNLRDSNSKYNQRDSNTKDSLRDSNSKYNQRYPNTKDNLRDSKDDITDSNSKHNQTESKYIDSTENAELVGQFKRVVFKRITELLSPRLIGIYTVEALVEEYRKCFPKDIDEMYIHRGLKFSCAVYGKPQTNMEIEKDPGNFENGEMKKRKMRVPMKSETKFLSNQIIVIRDTSADRSSDLHPPPKKKMKSEHIDLTKEDDYDIRNDIIYGHIGEWVPVNPKPEEPKVLIPKEKRHFVLPVLRILKAMKTIIDKYDLEYELYTIFYRKIREELRQRIAIVLQGINDYVETKQIIEMYRKIHKFEDDEEFVKEILQQVITEPKIYDNGIEKIRAVEDKENEENPDVFSGYAVAAKIRPKTENNRDSTETLKLPDPDDTNEDFVKKIKQEIVEMDEACDNENYPQIRPAVDGFFLAKLPDNNVAVKQEKETTQNIDAVCEVFPDPCAGNVSVKKETM